jgi:alpha-glucosidase (family GH31 glycosyl hydrolase)
MTIPVTTGDRLELPLLAGEKWWGGAVADGQAMPMGASPHRRNLATSAGFLDDDTAGANQSAPLLVSSRGRYVWSESPFEFAFDGAGGLVVAGNELVLGRAEATLGGAFRAAAAAHFPAAGRTVATPMLAAPQYNTWIEMPYRPTQDAVLAYVRGLLDAGFPPGVVMIDDRWSVDYGDWRFDRTRFPDPTAMARTLHAWGCAVMLWLVPFVSPDSENFRALEAGGSLVRRPDGSPAIRRWWNGYSAVLDLTSPEAVGWLRARLDALVDDGVDGFKFDAGDLRDYRTDDVTAGGTGPVGQCEAWARIGLGYRFNEFRACWKMGGQPLASPWRVLDGEHLAAVLAAVDLHQALVPEIIALARHAARTGEPILRPLAYAHRGYEDVSDQFLLGSDLLCAPVLARDAGSRHVVVPPGRWRGADGHVTEGPAEVEVAVTLASVPLWRREHAG